MLLGKLVPLKCATALVPAPNANGAEELPMLLGKLVPLKCATVIGTGADCAIVAVDGADCAVDGAD